MSCVARWIVTVAPTVEPVSLKEARDHLNDPAGVHDNKISGLIAAARQHIERVCQRALMPQSWRYNWDAFPAGVLELPGGLIRSITSVQYTDSSGAVQALSAASYQKDLDSEPARLYPLAADLSWPATQSGALNAVQVVAAVGYAKASDVPAPIRAALLLIVGDLFENREGQLVGQTIVENPAVKALLLPYKRVIP